MRAGERSGVVHRIETESGSTDSTTAPGKSTRTEETDDDAGRSASFPDHEEEEDGPRGAASERAGDWLMDDDMLTALGLDHDSGNTRAPDRAPSASPLPLDLREGVEQLSGLSMDQVEVHRESPRAQEVGARAFTQGTEIHLGPGQEEFLPHEAWHVVQQAQGRARPTTEAENGALINDDDTLEREADAMGDEARRWASLRSAPRPGAPRSAAQPRAAEAPAHKAAPSSTPPVVQRVVEGYTAKTLADRFRIMKGLNEEQKESMRRLHAAPDPYTQAEAREKVGAPPLEQPSPASGVPLAFRWGQPSPTAHLKIQSAGDGGCVMSSMAEKASRTGTNQVRGAAAIGLSASNLPKGKHRARSQTAATGISPNVAAQTLKLPEGKYEWLHLVAFSIGQTHVMDLSQTSINWLKRFKQRQQITENLVLGTEAANTAMIECESFIKKTLLTNSAEEWKVNLVVFADTENFNVDGVVVRYARTIQYQFMFVAPESMYSAPFIATFDANRRDRPPITEYQKNLDAWREQLKSMHPVPGGIAPPRMGEWDDVIPSALARRGKPDAEHATPDAVGATTTAVAKRAERKRIAKRTKGKRAAAAAAD